jgi:hypothetical protein
MAASSSQGQISGTIYTNPGLTSSNILCNTSAFGNMSGSPVLLKPWI